MVAFLDDNARVVGVQAVQPAVDVGRDRPQRAFVATQFADRPNSASQRYRFDGHGVNIGHAASDRVNLDRPLVGIAATRRRRHQFHGADGTAARLGLRRRTHHRADVADVFVAGRCLLMAATSASGGNPTEFLGRSQGGNQQDADGQEQHGLKDELDPPMAMRSLFLRTRLRLTSLLVVGTSVWFGSLFCCHNSMFLSMRGEPQSLEPPCRLKMRRSGSST